MNGQNKHYLFTGAGLTAPFSEETTTTLEQSKVISVSLVCILSMKGSFYSSSSSSSDRTIFLLRFTGAETSSLSESASPLVSKVPAVVFLSEKTMLVWS